MGLFDRIKKRKQPDTPFNTQKTSKEEIFKMILEQQAKSSPSDQFASGAIFDISRQQREAFEQAVCSNDALLLLKLFANAYYLFLNNPEVVGVTSNMVNKNKNDTDPGTWNANIFHLTEEDHIALLFMPVQSTALSARIIGIIFSSKGDRYYYCMLNKDEKMTSDVIHNRAIYGIDKIGEVKGVGFELMNSFLNCIKDDWHDSSNNTSFSSCKQLSNSEKQQSIVDEDDTVEFWTCKKCLRMNLLKNDYCINCGEYRGW